MSGPLASVLRRLGPCILGLLAAALVHAWVWGDPAGFTARMDFNGAPFEDFMGPYFEQGRALLAGKAEPVPGFLYTPFFAASMAPLAATGPRLAPWIWLVVLVFSCSALAGMVGPARGQGGRAVPPAGAATTFAWAASVGLCFPLFHGLHWGQVSALLTACMLGGLVLTARGRPWIGGMLVGLAAAIKLYPLVLLPVLACLPGRRACFSAAVSALVAGLGVPAIAMGWEPTLAFYGRIFGSLSASSGSWTQAVASQFAGAVAFRLGSEHWPLPTLVWIPRVLAVGLGVCALSRVAALARIEPHGAWLRPAVGLVCCLPLALPPAWPHYFAWLPMAWGLAWPARHSGPATLGEWWARGAVAISALLSSVPAFASTGSYREYFGSGALLLASLLVVPALLGKDSRNSPGGEAL